eukprot:scaffold178377_cov29-Prasinocladus_malaysianus.AAC.2
MRTSRACQMSVIGDVLFEVFAGLRYHAALSIIERARKKSAYFGQARQGWLEWTGLMIGDLAVVHPGGLGGGQRDEGLAGLGRLQLQGWWAPPSA